MPSPLITPKKKKTPMISADSRHEEKTGSSDTSRLLNRKRSAGYLTTMEGLDAGGHIATETAREKIIAAIRAELPELAPAEYPAGIVARCYLGDPYNVHTLFVSGGIIHHYETREPLPAELEPARSLALHPQYAFVEVYPDGTMRAVEKDGTIVVIRG